MYLFVIQYFVNECHVKVIEAIETCYVKIECVVIIWFCACPKAFYSLEFCWKVQTDFMFLY